MGGFFFLISAAAASQLSIGNVPLQPSDYLDGRAIAGATGAPVVMLTLSPRALARVKPLGPDAAVTLDGKPASARIADNTVEIDGQPDFDAAAALALRLSGKPPLPDSLDE